MPKSFSVRVDITDFTELTEIMKDRNVKGTGTFERRSYLVSVVTLLTICRMNDLTSEFNSRNSVYNASRFTALKMSGIVLYCWWKAFIWLKLSESLLQPTLVVINLTKQNSRIWFQDTRFHRCFIGQCSFTELVVLWMSEKLICDMGIGFN